MLRKFRVSNFKSFENDFELDLTKSNGYEFNKEAIKNGVVNNAIIYGQNGVGKSNLALAIFDIISHLTDKHRKDELLYSNYRNAYSNSSLVHFYYEFIINTRVVIYEYKKTDYNSIVFERFLINNEEVVLYDRTKNSDSIVNLSGAETLNTNIGNKDLSILKYIKNNTNLVDNEINRTFGLFFTFIEKMLFFRSLIDRTYFGIEIGSKNIFEDLIEKNEVSNFELFLNQAGIECKLKEMSFFDQKTIVFDFNGSYIPFSEAASTGTIALSLFYFWYQNIKVNNKVSFLFIDEFDAFYHHSLSALIVEKLKETGVQFILTTHNTSIMTNDLLRPDCYFTMTKKQIRSFSNSTPKELREAHNIEKMYKAGTFDVN